MSEIAKVRYTHDAVIDMIVANPSVSQNELALAFGFTPTWMSIMVNSDAFKEKLALRKSELVDPLIRATLTDRLQALANKSAEVLLDKLNATANEKTALKGLEIAARALGFGARIDNQVNVTNYVAVVPQRSTSSKEWAEDYGKVGVGRREDVVDVPVNKFLDPECAKQIEALHPEPSLSDAING